MDAFLCEALRTPIGKIRGALSTVRPDDLAGDLIKVVVERCKLPPDAIDDVILGCANQAGEDNRNVARMAVLLSGLPDSVPGATVNRLCGSGLEAILQAARAVRAGEGELFLAGGVESMTRAPWVMPKAAGAFPSGNVTVFDSSLGWRFPNPRMERRIPLESMGETAENVAGRYGIARADQDRFALQSHQRAVAAQQAGRFADEIVEVEVPGGKRGETVRVAADEGPRADSSLDALGRLKPVFRKDGGTVTAGNSSTLNDGAALCVVASAAKAKALGLRPMARIVAGAVAGVDPRYMGLGPVPAVRKALARAGWSQGELDLVELNEAFAAQSLAVLHDLELPQEKVNVNGGAIALGHPLGASGARIVATLLHELRRRGGRRGLATLCIGVGQGIAALFERVDG